MNVARRTVRTKNRTTGKKVNTSPNTSEVIEQGIVEPTDRASSSTIEQSLRANIDEITAEGWELSDQLLQFTADNNRDSSLKPEVDDDCTRFQIVEDAIHESYVVSDTSGPMESLVDPSKWFDLDGAEYEPEPVEQQQENSPEEDSSDSTCATVVEIAAGDTTAVCNSSSPATGVDEKGSGVRGSGVGRTQRSPGDERRRHPRQDRSDLIWVEYFDSSLECTGKAAARTENVGGGGMRVAVKNAPPELEKVIVSYPYRGFESCAIVRSRYQSEDGQERICLEFADKGWIANAACAPAENRADEFALRRRILLADDDSTFRRILGDILGKAGYDVSLAEDGEKALEKAVNEKPDLLITDGLMPKLHGFQVCKAVKELNPETKVIMLTAIYTSPNYRWEAHAKFHADDIITKPCQIADLLRKIEMLIPPLAQVA